MITWRKSSFSSNGGNCVEVAWRKSSFSNGGSACVEVTHASTAVLVRDSKNTTGPILALSERGWRALLARLG